MEEEIPLENYLVQGIFYWIGLSDAASEGTWRWMESHQNANYTNWWPGEGDDGTGSNCAFKSFDPSYLGWDDYICGEAEWHSQQIHDTCTV